MATLTYLEAISLGLREEMKRDEKVFCFGEDVGVFGGAFKVTKGFQEEFGFWRCFDTPLSDSAIIGAAIGAALMGMRPVAEIQFADFITCGFTQLVNNAAKIHYRWGAKVPMTVRCPSGGGVSGGPFHSQNPEAWFLRVPGLKVVCPSTPYDSKGLIKAAIRDDNPVIFFEHKYLYRRIKGEVPEEDYLVPIGKADLKREGTDLSVVTYGSTVHGALEAAERLAREDISVEVLDLRTIHPYDKEAVLATVKKTGKVCVIHEDAVTGGVGAEIAAFIAEHAFASLDAPVKRVGALDTPIPYAPVLEAAVLPNADKIYHALRDLALY